MALTAVFGVLAGVLSVLDGAPYIRDVLRRTTQPHRGAWLIWSVLTIVALTSQLADGAEWSIVMVAAQAVVTTTIFAFSIPRGVGGLSRGDLTVLAVAALGVVGWSAFSEPVLATICVVVADTLGVCLMLPKTWRDPGSETVSTYALASASGFLSTLAVGALEFALLLYPLYFFAANGLIALVIVRRTRALAA